MRWKRFLPLLLLIVMGVVVVWALAQRSKSPEIPFVRVTRGTITSTLNTNGKVEPIEWSAVRTEQAGTLQVVHVERGQLVQQGQIIAELDTADARAQLAAAEARIAQIRAELEVLDRGGRASEQAEIESGLARARADLVTAKRELESLERLRQKNAATQTEVDAARAKVQSAELQIQALERRSAALVSIPDKSAANARLRGAEAEATAARERVEKGIIRSPMTGIVYNLEARQGAYLNPGDLIANVGRLNQLRVIVYVDEPELGRVRKGMPVTITWDAKPGRQWKGIVDKIPTQIVPLGTRQVGEVVCIIENPDLTLLPGTNVNAEIRSQVVENALIIPKEAIRREGDRIGVLKLDGYTVRWQPIKIGAASVTHAEVLEGLEEGDAVALAVDRPLKAGDKVQAMYPTAR